MFKKHVYFPWVPLSTLEKMWFLYDTLRRAYYTSSLMREQKVKSIWAIMQKTSPEKCQKEVRNFLQIFELGEESNPLYLASFQGFLPGVVDYNLVLNCTLYPLLQLENAGPPIGILSQDTYRSLDTHSVFCQLRLWHESAQKIVDGMEQKKKESLGRAIGHYRTHEDTADERTFRQVIAKTCAEYNLPNPYFSVIGEYKIVFKNTLGNLQLDSEF